VTEQAVKPLLTPAELAERLSVSKAWVYRYRGPGRLVLGRTLVRYDYDQVRQHLEAGA
jgi:predicted DNA-binding transcriptional regulator AlpA